MRNIYKDMHEILHEGQIGNFKLEKFEITRENRPFRCDIPDGRYIQLKDESDRWNGCIMSNTPMEMRTNLDFLSNAHGDILIGGLGIGMILLPLMEKEDVKSITVIEKHKEIIDLTGSQLNLNDKVKIIEGDIFTYEFQRGTKFDCLYFDIWNYVNSDVYEEMKQLKKRYLKNRRSLKENPNAFIKCWAETEAKYNYPLR